MELRIRLPEESDVLDLHRWLLEDRHLRGRVTLVSAKDRSGHLGGVWEAVAVALGAGGVVAVFLQTFSDWLKLRQPGAPIEISVKPGETTVKCTKESWPEALKVLRELKGGDDAAT